MEMIERIKRDPRGQGDQGEASAVDWLLSHEAAVYMPFGHSRDIDMIALLDDEVVRVQVKTSTQFYDRRWRVSVCTRGGNRSWNGVTKYLDPATYDRLFVLVQDGRRWFIPSAAVGARTAIMLGGPRYAEYEIERGRPLRNRAPSLH